MVKPSVFSRLFKDRTSRKFIGKIFGIATVLFLILFGSTTPAKTTEPATKTESPTTVATVTYREATSWEKSGKTWRAIVFAKKPSNEELIKIAKELHAKNKTDYYNFFDDDAKLEEFKNWDVNYGKVRDRDGQAKLATECSDIPYCVNLQKNGQDAFPYPKEWADAHELAMMNEMFSGGAMRWELTSSKFEKLSDI